MLQSGQRKSFEEIKMEKILQTNYLTVGNVERYRTIMRYFYKRHRQMQGAAYRPELIQMMQENFSLDYAEPEMDQDLENLVVWGNLQKQQEFFQIRSIEEYRNKNFRYQITEEGILVEEMVYQLLNQKHAVRGALDEEVFRDLLKLLQVFIESKGTDYTVWPNIREAFRKVGADTANYIGYITSPEVDSRMKTEAFLVYKDRFVNYLRNFISHVQSLSYTFQAVVNSLSEVDQAPLVEWLYQKELEIPTFDGMSQEEVAEQVNGEFSALKNWFIGSAERPSEYDNLMYQTDQMIAKITGLIYYYGQEIHQYQSRKKDYLQLAKWFAQTQEVEEAKKMYAGIFGIDHTRHFFVSEASNATSNRSESWALEPGTLLLGPRGQGVRVKNEAKSIKIDHERQLVKIQEYQEKLADEQQKINQYFENGLLDFSQVSLLDRTSRQVFLKWISKAMAMKLPSQVKEKTIIEHKIVTELAFEVTIRIDMSIRIQVVCEDGMLEMPQVIMERKIG